MDDPSLDRIISWTGLAAAAIVAAPVLLAGNDQVHGPVALWWIAYVVFLMTFSFDTWATPWRPAWLTDRVYLTALVGSASAAYLLAPEGFTVVLLVVTAVTGAYVLSERGTRNQVVFQATVIAAGAVLVGMPAAEIVVWTVTFGAFQAFAAVMVHSRRREAVGRQALATAHAELRASSALLAESSRTSERLRIARELHDLVGHQLTALSLELEVASHHTDGAARDHVDRAKGNAKSLLGDVRRAVGELRVHTPGLRRPLEALVDGITSPEVSLEVVEDTEVDEQVALAVVRCVQEIVTNTLRHARAGHMWISVTATPGGVHVVARDDGRGTADLRPGNGLKGMRERVEQRGGELTIESSAGRGFRVDAKVPVP